MSKNISNRTYWPIGILCIIAIGIVLLYFLVSISRQQSIDPDNSYNESKLVVDANINNYLKIQKEFESKTLPFVAVNKIPSFDDIYRVYTPYFAKKIGTAAVSSAQLQETRDLFTLKPQNNIIYLNLKWLNKNIIINSIVLELDSLETKSKKRDEIILNMNKMNDVFQTDGFALPKKGAYHATFKINYQNIDKSDEPKTIFYKKVFFNIQS